MNIDELLRDDAYQWRQEVDQAARDHTAEDWTTPRPLTNPRTLHPPRSNGSSTRVRRWLPVVTAAVVVAGAAVAAGLMAGHRSQPTHSPAPTIPVQVTASINGRPHPLGATIKVAAGSQVTISARIHAPAGASIRNGYLYVASPPYEGPPNGTPGNVRILAHQAGALIANSLSATWRAKPAFGHKTLTAVVHFDYFKGSLSAGTDYPLVEIAIS